MATRREEELEDFLEKVDKIGSIISDLSSKDQKRVDDAQARADDYFSEETDKVNFDRTLINKTDDQVDSPPSCFYPSTSAEHLLREIARDARERAKIRQNNEVKADKLKMIGNELYRKTEFADALACYTKALGLDKSNVNLYTNRALTYFKLNKYKEAVKDCDTALMISEKFCKAYVVKGRALMMLKQYDAGIDLFEKAVNIDSSQKSIVDTLIKEAKHLKEISKEEEDCLSLYERENPEDLEDITNCIRSFDEQQHEAESFFEKHQRLKEHLNSDGARVLFRIKGGFNIIKNPEISSCIHKNVSDLSASQMELLVSFLDIISKACIENVENQKTLLRIHNFPEKLLQWLEASSSKKINKIITALLFIMSLEKETRALMAKLFDGLWLVKILILKIDLDSEIAPVCASILNNIALEENFRKEISLSPDRVLNALFTCIQSRLTGAQSFPEVSTLLHIIGNLILNKELLTAVSNKERIWLGTIELLTLLQKSEKSYNEIYALLGMLINLCSQLKQCPVEAEPHMETIIKELIPLIDTKRFAERVSNILRHLISWSPKYLEQTQLLDLEYRALSILKHEVKEKEPELKHTMQLLATMSNLSKISRRKITRSGKGLMIIFGLVNNDGIDDTTLGNGIFCLTNCVHMSGVSKYLVSTNIVGRLLHLIKTRQNDDLIKNAAILLGKLSKTHKNHLVSLQLNDGIKTLHSVMYKFT